MKLLALFFILTVSLTAIAEPKVIIAPEEDQDLKIKINKGGTATDVITITGATGVPQILHESAVSSLPSSTVDLSFDSFIISNLNNTIGNHASIGFRNRAAGELTARISAESQASNGRGKLIFQTGNSSGSLSTVGSVDTSGSWTLGGTGAFTNHNFNAAISFRNLAGFFSSATAGGGGSTCTSACASDDSVFGFTSSSGQCLLAWTSAGAVSACGTTLVDGRCMCAGTN
jgi:hypothetical protein